MITKLPKDADIAIGARYRAGYLLEQFGYTMGLAKLDGDGMVKRLPADYLDDVQACGRAV